MFPDDDEHNDQGATKGTTLEAAFIDPAYTWPPPEGEGRNAIELQASASLMSADDDLFDPTTNGQDSLHPQRNKTSSIAPVSTAAASVANESKNSKQKMTKKKKRGIFGCCSSVQEGDVVDPNSMNNASNKSTQQGTTNDNNNSNTKGDPCTSDSLHNNNKDSSNGTQAQQFNTKEEARLERRKNRYDRVPEGLLIYRLDTKLRKLSLVSKPNADTNLDTLVRELTIVDAYPNANISRCGINLVGHNGTVATLVACEQRTAIAWLETLRLMLEQDQHVASPITSMVSEMVSGQSSLNENSERVKNQYLNLANYSNKLIRSGTLPGSKKTGNGGAGPTRNASGIYYAVEVQHEDAGEVNAEALESIAKRRAVIKDSWDFYRMICSLLRDKRKYDETFRRMQLDPVYPYLNSMTGLNDPSDGGMSDKSIYQRNIPEYASMNNTAIAKHLIDKAEQAMPSLVEICKALAGSLGMEEVGVGPTKDVQSALMKAERKYNGDLLKVTDYCRSLLVVKDFPSLLALLELARDSFGPLIRRVKMSSLKSDYNPKSGGYRDCIINVELKEHICEIQVHLWPMWGICGVDGFRHYRHCLEYNTDSFQDPFESLEGLSSKTRAELIVMAEEAVVETPLDNLEWFHEKNILDYFAEAGLFINHGLDVWAEITLRRLIRLRMESPDIGANHPESTILYTYLAKTLEAQGKQEEAEDAKAKVIVAERHNKTEKSEADQSLWDTFVTAQTDAYDMVMDPNKKERLEEENLRREVKASKKQWRKIRNDRFKFLDLNIESSNVSLRDEEKKFAS